MTVPRFDEMPYARPDLAEIRNRYERITRALDRGAQVDADIAIADWQALIDHVETMSTIAQIRFNQDTRDADRKAEKQWFDRAEPELTELYVEAARALLEGPHAEILAQVHGDQWITVLRSRVASFDPALKEAMAEVSERTTAYVQRLADAEIEFDGKTLNLSGLVPYCEDADRAVRRAAQEARFGYLAEHKEELDRLYDELVHLRDGMGRALGHDGYTPLAYELMTRSDYGPAEVARFREQVKQHVVPLASELYAAQAERLGLDRLRFHDEALKDPAGNPKPAGDDDWVVARAGEMYAAMGPELDAFYQLLIDRGLADLTTRPGKAGGGFCADLPDHKVPFIYANFNGTTGDIEVLTHECGHAFQGYSSREISPGECRWPTAEACEIHSMALEFLTWPEMERFFGDDAGRFRRQHLIDGLLFLPYGCAVDDFQHWVYANPGATPAERHAQWQAVEREYLPHRDYEGLVHVADGGLWQRQQHIYRSPFYYIDYCLAQTGALQFWRRHQADPQQALADYVALCRLGGSQSYLKLLDAAGLASPFEDGTVADVVAGAREWLVAHP